MALNNARTVPATKCKKITALSVQDTRISRRKAVLSHSQFPLPYKNQIDVFLCFSVFLSLSSFVHLHDMCVRTGKQVGRYFHFRYRWLYITIDIGGKSGKRDELNGWVSASESKNEWKRDCGGCIAEKRNEKK